MHASHDDYTRWIPVLHGDLNLYHDHLLDRWVLSGMNKVVFLNNPSYEVLKRCDGKTDLQAICEQLCHSGVFQQATVHEDVVGIIQGFDIDGIIFNQRS